jgi:hypothetical protein
MCSVWQPQDLSCYQNKIFSIPPELNLAHGNDNFKWNFISACCSAVSDTLTNMILNHSSL